jgi:hypothetical protein
MAAINRDRIRQRGTMAAGSDFQIDLDEVARRGTAAFDNRAPDPGQREAAAVGGLTAVGMGAVFGGPVGLALGGLTGILAHLGNERQAAQLADWQNTLGEINDDATRAIDRAFNRAETQTDRDQVEARNTNWRNTMRILERAGPQQGAQILASLGQSGMLDGGARAELDDMETRREKLDDDTLAANRQLTMDHRKYLRGRADTLFQDQLAVDRQMQQARAILDDPEANIDHPFVQAELMKQLDQAKRNMLSNAEDMTDAMKGIGGTGALGTLAALSSLFFGAEKAEEMRFSREEWRTLLSANEEVARRQNAREREALYREAEEHVRVSESLGLPADESVTLMSRFRGLEAEADRPTMPARGGFATGVEGPKRPTNGDRNPIRRGINETQRRLNEINERERARREAEERERARARGDAAGAASGGGGWGG